MAAITQVKFSRHNQYLDIDYQFFPICAFIKKKHLLTFNVNKFLKKIWPLP
jgi:hypothetical protein